MWLRPTACTDKGALDPLAAPDEIIARDEEEWALATILGGVHDGYLPIVSEGNWTGLTFLSPRADSASFISYVFPSNRASVSVLVSDEGETGIGFRTHKDY